MFAPRTEGGTAALWVSLFIASSTATTIALACATPFSSLAALAAVHMRPREGFALMGLSWAFSQLVGFALHDYPRGPETIGWAACLATAAIASLWGAQAALRRMGPASTGWRLGVGYAAAFVAFKLVVVGWALFLGSLDSVIDPAILARQFARNGAILIGLYLLYRLLVAAGVPALRRPLATA
ncbi:MAG: hypothetical protein U0S50_06595 [Sphingopyxis sp.]|uniref:hypothetical protein n=1 Tax=Sphingopyxis sp. TaxID=1908224 RepID=UPI002ABABC5D|nr:hypothetical protein [Sphingopyxis sp.]MDZ3831469.1 hypothetical protein [Sphingopyxis sp.]